MNKILSIADQYIPSELTPRFHSSEWLIGYVLFFAFITLAVARFSRAGIYETLFLANTKLVGVVAFVRETMPLSKSSSWMLILNYFLSGGAVCYLFIQTSDAISLPNNAIVFIVPVLLLLWSITCLLLTRFLTGGGDAFSAPFTLKVIGAQLLGVIYFVCAILWLFISGEEILFAQIVLLLFIAESAFRVAKSANIVLKRGVSWYYIILYFCTLEILPLLMVYYVLREEIN